MKRQCGRNRRAFLEDPILDPPERSKKNEQLRHDFGCSSKGVRGGGGGYCVKVWRLLSHDHLDEFSDVHGATFSDLHLSQ